MGAANEHEQRATFDALVKAGVYRPDSTHPLPLVAFFTRVISDVLEAHDLSGKIRVLDCGCGNGEWLKAAGRMCLDKVREVELFGFDLSPRMVEAAKVNLADLPAAAALKVGDLLSAESYRFSQAAAFDVVLGYDVVQQLPPKQQYAALENMVGAIAAGGCGVVFDHDSQSAFGRQMAFKKFVTRYLHVPLVPRYYCNAVYPPLRVFSDRLSAVPGLSTRIVESAEVPKRALIIFKERG